MYYNEIEASTAQSVFSLTNLHILMAFSHLPVSQKSSKILGYADVVWVIFAPSLFLIVIKVSENPINYAYRPKSYVSL
jgi:hypothetical protein